MLNNSTSDLNAFIRHMEVMYERLGKLYSSVGATSEPTDLFPDALKELGFAAEELQVATEELRQQNEQITLNFASAEAQAYHYKAVFDSTPQAQMITTLDGKILLVNSAAAELLRLPVSVLVDSLLIRFVPLHRRTMFRSQMIRLQQLQQPQTWLSTLQLRTGELIELLFSTAIVPTDDSLSIHWMLQEAAVLQSALMQPPLAEPTVAAATENLPQLLLQRRQYRYSKGDVIFLQPQTIHYICQGLVKLSTLTANNEEVLLGLAGENTAFLSGSTALLTYQAIALTDVELVKFAIEDIHGELAAVLLPKLLLHLQQTEALLHVAGHRRTRDRLYYLLKLLGQEVGEPVADGVRLSVRLTHEDLANACCTTRVTMTRLLGESQRAQKIRFDRKFHLILRENF